MTEALIGVAQWVFWFVAMGVAVRWLTRDRDASSRIAPGVLRQPHGSLFIGLVCLFLFAGLGFSFVASHSRNWPLGLSISAAFALGGLYLVLDYLRTCVTFSTSGLTFSPLLRSSGAITWPEVTRITYSPQAKWLRIESASSFVRVPITLTNLPAFAKALLHHVHTSLIDHPSLIVLRDMAKGRIPSLWR